MSQPNSNSTGLSASIEDYIKVIYDLELAEEKATTKRIADRLDVRMTSVTGMVKHLASEGFLRHKLYYGVKLTDKGRRVALGLIRRHRIIEQFLCQTLGLKWDEVHEDAEVLEHAVSNRLIEHIYEFLGRPEFDPHGAPIPTREGTIEPRRGVTLDTLPAGTVATVVEVADFDAEFLRYLTSLGLVLGTSFRVAGRTPYGGPVSLEYDDRRAEIGEEAAARIRVEVQGGTEKAPTRAST